nr:LOW QUALITY PROTEIN: zinc finger protein 800-like [Nomia melanderi]
MQERRFDKKVNWIHNTYRKKSMKAKAKTKKPNGKFGKVKFQSKEVTSINPDLSQLYRQIDTSVSSLYCLSKVLANGSDEVKSILAYECDLVYECRICRSLFRSLVNLISHKRIYCKEKFDVTSGKSSSNNRDTICINKSNMPVPEACGNDRILRSQVSKEEEKKDLTTVVNMLQKKQKESLHSNIERLCLESVQSNSSVVYQTVEPVVSTQNHIDLMKTQLTEIKDMINERTAVLGPDGQILPSKYTLNDSKNNNEETTGTYETELTCSICNAKFSTKKTLAVHTRTLHTSHRLCYPCPCCTSTFANSWSVYRHLFKVHRKTNEQVRKFRSQIQEKAFIKDTTGAEDLQKEQANKLLTNTVLRVNETQEWMDHLESDTELQRCGGCGKRFDRKAALSSHSQYCHRRVAAYESTNKMKKTNKVSPDRVSNETVVTSSSSEISNSNETSIRVEAVATLSKADWDMLENGELIPQRELNANVTTLTNGVQEGTGKHNPLPSSTTSDSLEIIYTSMNKHKNNVGSKKRKNRDSAKRITNTVGNNIEKVDRALIMEKKIASIVNLQKLQCLSCKRKFTSVINLRRHAAIHVGWNRYRCKLCDFKCFIKCDCVAHCNKMHSAQNNRAIIEDMIIQISDDHCTPEQDVVLNTTNVEKCNAPEVVEISISPEEIQPEVVAEETSIDQTETQIASKAEIEIENEAKAKIRIETEIEIKGEAETEIGNEAGIEIGNEAGAELKNEAEAERKPEIVTEIIDINSDTFQEVVHVNKDTQEPLSNGIKGQNTVELDPELRRMVMEVIFGSSETNSVKQVEEEEIKLANKDEIEISSRGSDSKESDIICLTDNPRPQRPIRNKIKPLKKDFIYDLKEVTFRKDSLIVKPFNKTFTKKSLIQEENNVEKDADQPSKRFKSLPDNNVSIHCEDSVMDKCDITFDREDLKGSLPFSQCHS